MQRLAIAPLVLLLAAASCSKPSSDAAATPASSASVTSGSTLAAANPSARPPPHWTNPAAPQVSRLGVLAPGTGIALGQKIPEVSGRDLDGKVVALSSLYAKGPILLAFYRGGWCPFCNGEIHALTTAFSEYQKRGVTPVAISVDTPDNEAKTKATYAIPFPVLSDSDATILDAFHVAKELTPEEYASYRGYGIDMEAYSGRTHHKIAVPSLFLVDTHGVVRWAHSDPDYKVRPTTPQILAAVDGAKIGAI